MDPSTFPTTPRRRSGTSYDQEMGVIPRKGRKLISFSHSP